MSIRFHCSFGPQAQADLPFESFSRFQNPKYSKFKTRLTFDPSPLETSTVKNICAVAQKIVSASSPSDQASIPKTYYIRVDPSLSYRAGTALSDDGKKVFINIGERESKELTPAELAIVLSHERAHIESKNPFTSNTKTPKHRKEELWMDSKAGEISAQAGFDPEDSIRYFYKEAERERECVDNGQCAPYEEIDSSHPSDQRRLAEYVKALPKLKELYESSQRVKLAQKF